MKASQACFFNDSYPSKAADYRNLSDMNEGNSKLNAGLFELTQLQFNILPF